MPTIDQKNSKSTHKRGSLSGEKTRKTSTTKSKKKKSKKSAKSEPCSESREVLEVERLTFPKEADDSDSSNNKTQLLPALSTSDITINSVTPRAISTDSLSTRSSATRQTDTGSCIQSIKSESNNTVDSVSAKLSNISLKTKSTKSKSKPNSPTKKENTKLKKTEVKPTKPAMPNIIEISQIQVTPVINESIRWENELESPDSERERIRIYKMNRRKRYLAAAQVKGLGWVKQYGVNGFPLADESGVADGRRDLVIVNDYSQVNMIRNSQSHSILNDGKVISYGH